MRNVGKFHSFPRGLSVLCVSAAPAICYLLLAVWTIGLFSPGLAQDEGKIKIETEPVNLDVIVNDVGGKQIYDLKEEDFEVYEDGGLQKITRFKPPPRPLRVILLFDMSVSMAPIFPAIKAEALKFVDSLNRPNELMIASFDMELRWHNDWAGKALATTEILDLKLGSVSNTYTEQPFPRPPRRRPGAVDGNTNLYGALHNLFDRFGGRGENEVALLFSDGVDRIAPILAKQRPVNDSKQVIQEAQASWTQIYAACFNTERKKASNCKFLSEVADATGGRSLEFESQPELAQVMKKTFDELRSQYTLAYHPSSQGNRIGYHKIKVVVKKPDLIARAREGYLISK